MKAIAETASRPVAHKGPASLPAVPAATALLKSIALPQHNACACGGGCPRCKNDSFVQTKLRVSEPGDRYEQEADRMADRIMRTPSPSPDERPVAGHHAAVASGPAAGVPAPGGGQPMDAATLGFFESRFNRDLSDVRIHNDKESAAFANDIGARAFTVGSHIGFASGEYAPETHPGKRLLAHELTHTIQQANGAPLAVARVPRVAGQAWTVDHSDIDGLDEIVQIGVAVDYLGVSSSVAQLYGYIAARRSQWATKKGLYVRALDFLRDNRDRFDVPDVHGMIRRVLAYCDSSSATVATLNDSFYEQLLVSAVYSPGPVPAAFTHISGNRYEVPGRDSSATDFAPSGDDSLLRRDLAPDTAITGGFSSGTDLLIAYGAQSGSVASASVSAFLGSFSGSVPSPLRGYLNVLATDPTIFSVLQYFLRSDGGRFVMQSVGYGGAHYTNSSPPSIEVDDDIFPGSGTVREQTEIGVRATLAHELYHYALDRADVALALNELGHENDHRVISIVEDRYKITEMLRAGQAPLDEHIECMRGYVGGDPKPRLRRLIVGDNRSELRSFVGTRDFLDSTVYTMLVTLLSTDELRRTGGMGHHVSEFLFDPSQVTDIAYLAAINGVILRKAFELAADIADRRHMSLSAVWGDADYQSEIRAFILRLIALASHNRTEGAVALASMI